MKTHLKQIILFSIILFSGSFIIAQDYTYSSSPSVGSYVSNPNDCGSWVGNVVKMKLKSVNASYFTFTIKKCDNSAFSGTGKFYVGWNTAMQCSNTTGNSYVNIPSGVYEYDITVSASWSDGNVSHWQGAFSSNQSGVTYNAGNIDITRTAVKPDVITNSATDITTNGARVSGTINTHGHSTAYSFQYGTSTSFGHSTSSTNTGSTGSNVLVSTNITNQPEGTTIYYRCVAYNDGGLTYGNTRTFTTNQTPYLSINPSGTLNVGSGSGSGSISVSSNKSWSASSNQSWLPITSGNSGNNNGTITYTLSENTSTTSSRTAIITVSASGVSSKTLTIIQAAAACPTPTADFYTNKTSGDAPLNVQFTSNSNAGSGQTISSYYWEFGDGTTSNSPAPLHTYDNAGTYTVKLTVANSCGSTDIETKSNYISVSEMPVNVCSSVLLNFPQNYATGMPQSMKFEWEDSHVNNPTYELIITDNNSNLIFYSSDITKSNYEFAVGTFYYNQTYKWKVRALQNSVPVSEWSETRYFTIKPVSPDVPAYCSALGHLNDAVIYKNKNDYTGIWQCVEYVKRYHNVVYGLIMRAIGNANAYFWSSQLGFGRFYNNNSFIPQVGDLVCLSGGEYGHVAIVREVEFTDDGNNSNDFVYIAQQNVGSNIANHVSQKVGLKYINNKYEIASWIRGYKVQGWRRAVPTVITPTNNKIYNTTKVLVKWVKYPNAKKIRVDASRFNPETGCYEPIPGFNGVDVYKDF